jgi:hypothetical protein
MSLFGKDLGISLPEVAKGMAMSVSFRNQFPEFSAGLCTVVA